MEYQAFDLWFDTNSRWLVSNCNAVHPVGVRTAGEEAELGPNVWVPLLVLQIFTEHLLCDR